MLSPRPPALDNPSNPIREVIDTGVHGVFSGPSAFLITPGNDSLQGPLLFSGVDHNKPAPTVPFASVLVSLVTFARTEHAGRHIVLVVVGLHAPTT